MEKYPARLTITDTREVREALERLSIAHGSSIATDVRTAVRRHLAGASWTSSSSVR